MTIIVDGPDGISVQFPDGTDRETISRAMKSVIAKQNAGKPTDLSGTTALAPNKYEQAAQDELKSLRDQTGSLGPLEAGYTRRLTHGATFGADNTIMAALQTPLEMIKRGTLDPVEAYNYTKAREDALMDESRKNTGALGTAAELLGGAVSGVGAARGGLTTSRFIGPDAGLLARTGTSAADAAGFGAVSGFNEGNGLEDRLSKAGHGAAIGAGLGVAAPLAMAAGGAVLSPVISNVRARINPTGYAQRQVARGIAESGQTPDQLALDVIQAGNEGQGVYTLADAMGNSGQELLSTAARGPGPGRTAIADALNGRQVEQGRRVASTIAEGFDTPQTASQTRNAMTAARDATADAEYGAARTNATPVDVTNVIDRIDQTLSPGVNRIVSPADNIGMDSIETALSGIRRRLTDGRSNLTDFTSLQRLRQDIADQAQSAMQSGHGNRARMLGQVVRELDASLENASAGYQQANRNFRQASQDIEAIDAGRTAANRGRYEDTIPAYEGLTPNGQRAFRTGYADQLIERAQSPAAGVNKAREFTGDAFQQESAAMAPRNDMMQRRLARENTMFETRARALGGSKTADNLANDEAMGLDPRVVAGIGRNLLTGNYTWAIRDALAAGKNFLSGNTPEVRAEVARLLLQRAPDMRPGALNQMVDQIMQQARRTQEIMMNTGRGAAGALAVGTSGGNNRGPRSQ